MARGFRITLKGNPNDISGYLARAGNLLRDGESPAPLARELRVYLGRRRVEGDTLNNAHDILACLEGRARGDQKARVRAMIQGRMQ